MKRILHYPYIGLILSLVLTCFAYLNTLDNGFVWDDGYFVGYTPYVQWQDHLPQILTGLSPMSYGQVYRPVRSIAYIINYQLYGENPRLYHLQSLLVYLAIITVVWLYARRLFSSPWPTTITALVFALHPLHTEAVSWITASFDTIGILFFFLALLFYHQPERSRLHRLFVFLAFFTYELTFVIIPILIAYQWLLQRDSLINAIRKPHAAWISLGIYGLAKLVLGLSAQSPAYPFGSVAHALLFAPVLVARYIWLMLAPVHQSINHQVYPGLTNLFYEDFPQKTLSLRLIIPEYYIPLLTCILICLVIYSLRHHLPRTSFFGSWILISLIPVLGLIPQNSIFAERYTSIALFGLAGLVAEISTWMIDKMRFIGICLTILYIALLMYFTIDRNQVWQDLISFWGHQNHLSTQSPYIYRQLAASYYFINDFDLAIEYYQYAYQLLPTSDVWQKIEYLTSIDKLQAQ